MTTGRTRAVRRAAYLLAAGALAAGCSADPIRNTGGDAGAGGRPPSASATPSPASPPPSAGASPGQPSFTPDPDRIPRTRADALRLARAVAFLPRDWGDGFVAQDPAESDPDTWAVLDETCRWTREPLPGDVLAAVSRYSELPLGEGRGAVRVTAVVTVHTTVASADDRLSTTLEEVMRCPEQEIRPGERITDLNSLGRPAGTSQDYADDSVFEAGTYVLQSGGTTLTHPYQWTVDRLGPVTIAVSVRGADDEGVPAPLTVATRGTAGMRARVVDLLESEN
ncbi:hypothetical protein BJP40_16245 [Streptomyces sp. CC53]|nr:MULTISPECIES: hypothetical protein [unclassified Streptomyces]OII65673.1 hypothetical protein BJP40_16245 [Streptomyces sp. CC53]